MAHHVIKAAEFKVKASAPPAAAPKPEVKKDKQQPSENGNQSGRDTAAR
jgi:hypothetical protein